MPDHIWSQLGGTSGQTKQNGVSSYEMLQFPKAKVILWDPTPIGTPVYLSVACYRKPRIHLSDKLLRLLHRQCENNPLQTLSTILLGSLIVDDDGEGITFHIDRLDTRQNADNSLNLVPEDITVPFQVYINGTKERESNVEEFTQTLKSLKERCISKESIDLGSFLLTRGWCNYYTGGENCIVHLDFNVVTLATEFKAIPITPVPIVPTALSKNLAGPLSFSHIQGVPKTGYLTMDHTRKLLLVLESDPKALSLPIVGIWISGAPVVHHPFVWSACLRYIYNEHIQDRVCSPPENFLVVLYSPLHSKPEFYECGTKNGTSGLDFELHCGYEASNMARNVKNPNNGVISMDLNRVQVGPKREIFDAALNVFSRNRCADKSIVKSSGPEDMEPRLTPAPLVAMAPMIQNLVPDVSFVLTEPPPGAQYTNQQHIQAHKMHAYPSFSKRNSEPNSTGYVSSPNRGVNQNKGLPSQNNHNNRSVHNNGRQPATSNAHMISQTNVPNNNYHGNHQYSQMPLINNGQQPFNNSNLHQVSNGVQPFVCARQNPIPSSEYYRPNIPGSYSVNNEQYQQSTPNDIPVYYHHHHQYGLHMSLPNHFTVPSSVPLNHNNSFPQYSSAPRQPPPLTYNTVPNTAQIQQNFQQIPFQNSVRNEFFPQSTLCSNNNVPVYQKRDSAFHLVQNPSLVKEDNQLPQSTQRNLPPSCSNRQSVNRVSEPTAKQCHVTVTTSDLHVSQSGQNVAQADSTCSNKSSDDSGLSVTPDRSNPSPKTGSPENKSQNFSKPFSMDLLNKEQCSPEVYNLLMQQNTQLQQLQSQIQQLLQQQQQQNSTTSVEMLRNTTTTPDKETRCYTLPVSKRSDTLQPLSPQQDGINQNKSNVSNSHINQNEDMQPPTVQANNIVRDGSDSGSAGLTPVEIRHKGILPLNSTQLEDIEPTRDDLLTVMNNIGLNDRAVSRQSEESPSFHSSSTRSNSISKNSNLTSSPPSASMCINSFPSQILDDSQSSRQEANSENPHYYENLIANIRQFLNSHDDNPDEPTTVLTDDPTFSTDHTTETDNLINISSLQSFLKSAEGGKHVDTTLIPKIDYMSMMFDSDSDTSVEINAMAMKYLKDEQLTQMMKLQHRASTLGNTNGEKKTLLRQLLHSDMPDQSQNNPSVNDMTFATRKYMEKHGLLDNGTDSSDKSIDYNYQMKTDYSVSSNEMASPVRQTARPIQRKDPTDAYTKLRLLKSPVKKEIVPRREAVISPDFSPQSYNIPNYCQQFSSDSSPIFDRGNSKPLLYDQAHNQASINDDDKILDIVKLKQLPKLL
ncbi:hypothetical protein SNE40_018419 [Patella caerulea]|uniref:STIL N-terminal domain-containing protein n=1 Tax=Patella caerulea TaxID=87958 RepID=A0AAN8PH92_PATCE